MGMRWMIEVQKEISSSVSHTKSLLHSPSKVEGIKRLRNIILFARVNIDCHVFADCVEAVGIFWKPVTSIERKRKGRKKKEKKRKEMIWMETKRQKGKKKETKEKEMKWNELKETERKEKKRRRKERKGRSFLPRRDLSSMRMRHQNNPTHSAYVIKVHVS